MLATRKFQLTQLLTITMRLSWIAQISPTKSTEDSSPDNKVNWNFQFKNSNCLNRQVQLLPVATKSKYCLQDQVHQIEKKKRKKKTFQPFQICSKQQTSSIPSNSHKIQSKFFTNWSPNQQIFKPQLLQQLLIKTPAFQNMAKTSKWNQILLINWIKPRCKNSQTSQPNAKNTTCQSSLTCFTPDRQEK